MRAESRKVQKSVESYQKQYEEDNWKVALCCREADVKYPTNWSIEIWIDEPHESYVRCYAQYNNSKE